MAEAGNQKIYAGKGLLCKLFSGFFRAVLRLSQCCVTPSSGRCLVWARPLAQACFPLVPALFSRSFILLNALFGNDSRFLAFL